jgi:hypothetical protein
MIEYEQVVKDNQLSIEENVQQELHLTKKTL